MYCSWTEYCVIKLVGQDCHLCNDKKETDTKGNNRIVNDCDTNKHAHPIKKWIHKLTNECSHDLKFHVKCNNQFKGEFYLCKFIIIL